MTILLYNTANGVTRNFIPHLWMFQRQAITRPEHEGLLIYCNARGMNEQESARALQIGQGEMLRSTKTLIR